MSHYYERLEKDLAVIRSRISGVAERIEGSLKSAVHAALTRNRALAYQTALCDHPINREIRRIDAECHAFVARHLPSAGHLRFVSSVLRLDVALERIGDYAESICRQAASLKSPVPPIVARDIDLMGDQSRSTLSQAVKAFLRANPELARGTMGMADQNTALFSKVFRDLVRAGREGEHPIEDLFALLVILYRLERVSAQAKNICEEAVFATLGETKAPKIFSVLFVDRRNDCWSQMAEAYARKAFPNSGRYASTGWAPAEALDSRFLTFMDHHGFDLGELGARVPGAVDLTPDELSGHHVIVAMAEGVEEHLPEIPFKSVLLEWRVDQPLDSLDHERAEEILEEGYRDIANRVTGLMETLHGEGAS